MSVARLLGLVAIAAAGLSHGTGAQAQTMPSKGYLCCNLWSASAFADDGNKHDPSKRPLSVGTPVIPLTFNGNQLKFEANGQQYTLANYYSTNLSADQFIERWIVRWDPRRRLAGMPAVVQKEIKAGRVMRGMSRSQVAMALGFPTATNTPRLDVGEWKYVPYSGYEFLVLFDDKGVVRGVQSDDPNTRAAMYSPTPVPVVRPAAKANPGEAPASSAASSATSAGAQANPVR